MKTVKENALDYQPRVVMPLLAVVLLLNMFLFSIAYSNASFSGTEKPLPDPFAPAAISQKLDNGLNAIAANLQWSVSTAVAVAQPKIVAFLGLQDYKFGAPLYSSLSANPAHAQSQVAEVSADGGQVLGASIVNPAYADSLTGIPPVQPLPTFIVIHFN